MLRHVPRCVFAFLLAPAALSQAIPPGPAAPPPAPEPVPSDATQAKGPRVVVTAFRRPIESFETARSMIVVDEEVLLRRSENSVLDALNKKIGIWVEKRTATTSDPVLRGLSGANLLATIDGNTLTTFWGEGGFAGDDMYGKVDAESVERIEVIQGPASVQYGSNALGGVINFITRKPSLPYPDEGVVAGGRFKTSYETVNQGKMLRLDAEAAVPDLRFRVGGTWRDLEDGESGAGQELVPSGGRERNVDLAAEYLTGTAEEHAFFQLQQVARRDIARFYRPSQRNENDRTGLTAGWRSADRDAENLFEASFYYQWKEDRRLWDTGESGVAHWQTYATDLLVRSDEWLPRSQSVLGASFRLDQGQSPDDEEFTMTFPDGRREKASPDADWYDFGVFFENETQLTDWLSMTIGVRYDYFIYKSYPDEFYSSPGGNNDVDRVDENESALTGGIAFQYAPHDDWRVGVSWSRGFRYFAPKFGIVKLGFGVLVPSGLQDPVYADNYELTVKHRSEGVQSEFAVYYTNFDGFQETQPGSFRGQNFYDYDGNGSFEPDERVFVVSGGGRAVLHGVEWQARIDPYAFVPEIPMGFYVSGGFMWNYGRDLSADEPMRHTHPARGLVSIGYDEPTRGSWYAALDAEFVRKYDRIPSGRLSGDVGYRQDPQNPASPLVRPYGLPGYTVLNLRAGARVHEKVRVGMNVDNVTDKHYRPAQSRMDAFGISARLFVEIDV